VFDVRDVLVERSVVLETSEVEGEAAVSEALGDVFADQGFRSGAREGPLQLFDGSILLDLIEKHTDLKVRIVMPARKS
jgi:hypothetical protein